MGSLGTEHQRWYRICPSLPFSLCGNLLFTLLFIIFLPAVMVIGPALVIIYYTGWNWPYWYLRRKSLHCCGNLAFHLFCFLIVMPICLAVGMVVALIVGAFALVPLYYYSIHFFVRLSIAGCRTKL